MSAPEPKGGDLEPEEMKSVAVEVADLMRVLSHPNRLLALCELVEGERAVSDLADRLGLRPQAMSQQLSILRNRGLVSTRRDGQTIYYALAREDLRRLMTTLYETYCRPRS